MFAKLLVKVQQKSTWAGLGAICAAVVEHGFTPLALPAVMAGIGLVCANA